MALFKTKSEKKSLVITTLLSVALILALSFFGLTYLDPPQESGIAVNFGTSQVGSGIHQPTKPIKTAPSKTSQPEVSEPEETKSVEQNEEVVTQDVEKAPVISEKQKKETTSETPTPKPEPKAEEAQPEKPKEEPQKEEIKKPDPKPDQSTTDALNNILNGPPQDGQTGKGEGNDQTGGDKGDPNGQFDAKSYYGQGTGLDGDGNYRLGGRRALAKKKYVQDCNESGTVVVEIKVNRQGEVVRATPGVKGTTNTNPCLLEPAKRAALDTKFNADANAPAIQTGKIIYEFQLSD